MPSKPPSYFGHRELRQRDLPRIGEALCWYLRVLGRVLRWGRRPRPTS